MDADQVLTLRASATTVWVVCTVMNCLVLFMVFFHTPKDYRNCSILLGCAASVSISSGTIGWAVIHQNEAAVNETYPVVSFGSCNLVGAKFCYQIDQLCYALICFGIFFTPFCMAYRLYALVYRQLLTRGLVVTIIVLASPWVYVLFYRLQWYVEPSDIASAVSIFGQQYVFYGYQQPDTWQFRFMNSLIFSPHFACALTLILRQCLVFKINRVSSSYSGGSHGLHRIFAWMLTIQGIVPLVTAVGTTITFMVRVDSSTNALLGAFSYVLMNLAPILEAVVVLVCLPPYWKALKRMFGFQKKVEAVTHSTASHHYNTQVTVFA